MSERMCYVMTARLNDEEWVCCVFDTEAAAVAAHTASTAADPEITYEVSLAPFHSQTDTMPR